MTLPKRAEILEESKKRLKQMFFGDPVTNICAGDGNPMFHSWFVEYKVRSRKNRYGITHNEYLAKCTDKKGHFYNIDINVIYPGHLPRHEADELFQPVWEAKFGKRADTRP